METDETKNTPSLFLAPVDDKELELLLADWRDAVRICHLPSNYPFEGVSDS